jgi:hypothetical protein
MNYKFCLLNTILFLGSIFFDGKPSSHQRKDAKGDMGNHVSEINQNKGRDTWFKDTFSVTKRSQSCFMQTRIAPCGF